MVIVMLLNTYLKHYTYKLSYFTINHPYLGVGGRYYIWLVLIIKGNHRSNELGSMLVANVVDRGFNS